MFMCFFGGDLQKMANKSKLDKNIFNGLKLSKYLDSNFKDYIL